MPDSVGVPDPEAPTGPLGRPVGGPLAIPLIPGAARVMGVCAATARTAAANGSIPTFTLGSRRLVPVAALADLLRCSAAEVLKAAGVEEAG